MARPKRVFTEEEINLITMYAHDGCYSQTIAAALNIPISSLKRHYGRKMTQLRALGKCELKHNQRQLAKHNPQMAKFLGINELGQTDKVTEEVTVRSIEIPEEQREAVDAAAQAYKLRLA